MSDRVKGSLLGHFEEGDAQVCSTIDCCLHLDIIHRPSLAIKNMPCLYPKNVVGKCRA